MLVRMGISPFEVWSVVWNAYRMLCNSNAQFFLAPSNHFFSPYRIAWFVTSVWPFFCKWATNKNLCQIPMFLVKYLKELQSNCFPLSKISVLGIPNRQIILPHTKSITFRTVMVGMASASGHLEKYSTATITNFFCPTVLENGSKMSIPHCENGHGLDIRNCGIADMLIALANLWQTLHFFTNSLTSFFVVG